MFFLSVVRWWWVPYVVVVQTLHMYNVVPYIANSLNPYNVLVLFLQSVSYGCVGWGMLKGTFFLMSLSYFRWYLVGVTMVGTWFNVAYVLMRGTSAYIGVLTRYLRFLLYVVKGQVIVLQLYVDRMLDVLQRSTQNSIETDQPFDTYAPYRTSVDFWFQLTTTPVVWLWSKVCGLRTKVGKAKAEAEPTPVPKQPPPPPPPMVTFLPEPKPEACFLFQHDLQRIFVPSCGNEESPKNLSVDGTTMVLLLYIFAKKYVLKFK